MLKWENGNIPYGELGRITMQICKLIYYKKHIIYYNIIKTARYYQIGDKNSLIIKLKHNLIENFYFYLGQF